MSSVVWEVAAEDLGDWGWACESCDSPFDPGDIAYGHEQNGVCDRWQCESCFHGGVPIVEHGLTARMAAFSRTLAASPPVLTLAVVKHLPKPGTYGGGWASPSEQLYDAHFGTSKTIDEGSWDGSASRFTDEQYKNAAAACDASTGHPKSDCFLPHHEPGGAVNRAGVHAAAGRVSSLKGHAASAVSTAKAHLRGHYSQLDEKPPDSLK